MDKSKIKGEHSQFSEEDFAGTGSRQLLRVTFPGSEPVCYSSATATFLETLKRIGADRLKDISLYVNDVPLFSQEIDPRYKAFTKGIGGGWYAIIQSGTEQKYMQLSSIKQQLGLDIAIEIGTDFDTDTPKDKGKRAPKAGMMVEFPDGEYIATTRPHDTYFRTLEKIGISQLYKKKIQSGNKLLVTKEKSYPTQVQTKDGYWVNIPSSSEGKYNMLKVVGERMHIDLTVTLL